MEFINKINDLGFELHSIVVQLLNFMGIIATIVFCWTLIKGEFFGHSKERALSIAGVTMTVFVVLKCAPQIVNYINTITS